MSSYPVRRMPALAGPAAWNAILGPQAARPSLEGARTADVVIIGAGFGGLSAARRLRQLQPDAKVVVLDAGQIAESSSGRNSGFMIDLPHDLASDDYAGSGDDRAVIAVNRHGIAFARDAVGEYGIDRNYFDPAGKVNGAASAKAQAHNESYARHLASLGEGSEMLDARQMAEMTGSHHYGGGLYTPGTVMLQPAGYIRGLAAGLERAGVDILENSAVTGLERRGQSWRVKGPRGHIDAGRVILTVNGHLESFGFARGRLMQLFLFAVMTPELDADALRRLGGQSRWGITPSDPMGTTMRRIDTAQGGNRIITRTCATFLPGMEPSEAMLARTARVHRRKFADRFPAIADVPMDYSWAGHLCLTWNGVSVMAELEPGLFSACCCNGLGTVRSTLTGMAAADLAAGKPSDISAHFLAESEPAKLAPAPFAGIGANLYLKWREWQARRE